jgi:excisionase family DNA binding protein
MDDRFSSPQSSMPSGRDRLLTPGEVATLFRVDPKTVTRWASAGRIGSIRTPGGHRRFRESEVRALLRGVDSDVSVPAQSAHSAPLASRPGVPQ